ncbi:hypothetical protein M409DRAFT_16161 [Zasmidium cellare ATCC 36951]|uniref:Phosphatidylglycerol/phosphatidylinositol transfer protein n=1 Tax=Zasmidium cellare ATCC 36951 TaxID=1080233 RepID=A0A6A6D6N7_ZASCE|nr:uncharacterized protein M409DRAFT_16161 [Zasmidium cellare ATCC 36951]KAF2173892.1 hypothetical protein M409DRAFT_16161 [Zasmidium cellare ATCC 36951]
MYFPLLVLYNLIALARSYSIPHQIPFTNSNNDLSVPGTNPFTYCTDPKSYILQISSLNITLSEATNNKPNLSVSLDAHLIQTIENGAKVRVQISVKRDGRSMSWEEQEFDLCEVLGREFDVECPVKSGVETRERVLKFYGHDIERVIVLNAWTRNQERVVCLVGALKF